jgi:hypothetical protein
VTFTFQEIIQDIAFPMCRVHFDGHLKEKSTHCCIKEKKKGKKKALLLQEGAQRHDPCIDARVSYIMYLDL